MFVAGLLLALLMQLVPSGSTGDSDGTGVDQTVTRTHRVDQFNAIDTDITDLGETGEAHRRSSTMPRATSSSTACTGIV